ncbi:hypothetical protein ACCS85_26755 [Rhizobium ruizarguesonis]
MTSENPTDEIDASILIRIKSPKATTVKKTHVETGDIVVKGQLLYELQTWEEEKLLSEIRRHTEETTAKLAEVQGSRVANKLDHLREIVSHRRIARSKSVEIRDLTIALFEAGDASLLDVIPKRQDVIARSFQLLQAVVERDMVERNVDDSLIVLNHVLSAIEKEAAYVQRQIDRLSITAPAHGKINSFVNELEPVELGHVLCSIEVGD